VADAGVNPLEHYLQHGADEGRNPSPSFVGSWYLHDNPDVATSGMNPLVHYALFGRDEGRSPSPLESLIRNGPLSLAPTTLLSGRPPAGGRDGSRSLGLEIPVEPADVDVVSLDCWDTVLFRHCHPESTKLAGARYLLYRSYHWIHPDSRSVLAVYRARLAAERKVSSGPDAEYLFDRVVPTWLQQIMLPATPDSTLEELLRELRQFEIGFEQSVTYPNPELRRALEPFKDKTLALVSDFYFSGNDLLTVVRANAIESRFDAVLVSGEVGVSKRSGGLYQHLIERLDLPPDRMIHIGDNELADVVQAEKSGLRAVHHKVHRPDRLEQANEGRLTADHDSYKEVIESELWETALGGPPPAVDDAGDEMWSLGVRTSPIFAGLVLRVAEEAAKRDAERVYFVTREGGSLQELYEKYRSARPYGLDAPPSTLLELSRVATFGPSLRDLSEQELMRLWTMYPVQSPAAFLASLGESDDLVEHFERAGLPADQPVQHPWDNEAFTAVLNDPAFAGSIRVSQQRRRDALRQYLEHHHFTPHKSLFVEVGWRGSIQDNLSRLLDTAIHGVYLGLFAFLNPQPPGSTKVGWLFDDNLPHSPMTDRVEAPSGTHLVTDVAPIEMLLTKPEGTVVGHAVDPATGAPVALRHREQQEEQILTTEVSRFQQGMRDGAAKVFETVSIHALTSDNLRNLSRSLLRELTTLPPPALASTFHRFSHNETFGTGEVEDRTTTLQLPDDFDSLPDPKKYRTIADRLVDARWPEGAGAALGAALASTTAPSRHVPTSVFVAATGIRPTGTVGIFAPPPMVGSGGHLTIYQLAEALRSAGLEVTLYFEDLGAGTADAVERLAGTGVEIVGSWASDIYVDYAIATVDYSADHVAKLPAGHRGYLVQDFEAQFNPVGDRYAAAEVSYIGDFDFLCVGNWLGHLIETRYGRPVYCSGLGADRNIYRVLEETKREHAVCFLYQPDKPRRATELGLDALRHLQRRRPDVTVYFYGSNATPPADIQGESLGLIRNLHELNELYNRSQVGLCISMSNPSRIPYEMMAAGMVPVDVYRYNNLFDYENGTAILALQTAASLGDAMVELFASESQLERHRDRCLDFAADRLRRWEVDAMVNLVLARITSIDCPPASSRISYTLDAFVSKDDRGDGAVNFCAYQRALGTHRTDRG
jgi:FMN phosphatase YigB (HAD superfamily)